MTPEEREFYGRLVRMVWVEWAKEQPNPKPSWLLSWEKLSESDREVDRRIGEKVVEVATGGRWQEAIREAVEAERRACASDICDGCRLAGQPFWDERRKTWTHKEPLPTSCRVPEIWKRAMQKRARQ